MTSLRVSIASNANFAVPQSAVAVLLSSANAGAAMVYIDPADYPGVVDGSVPYEPIIGDPPDNRPAGQPYGGILLANAQASGDPTAGPFPAFLASDDSLPELVTTFRNALPAPIKMRIVRLPTVEI